MTYERNLSRQAENLKSLFREWIPKRKNTVHTLRVLADELLALNDNVCKAQVVGSSYSVVGFCFAAAGFGLAFATGGASAVASVIASGVGGGLGATGGLVSAGSVIAEFFIQRNKFSTATKIITEDQKAIKAIKAVWEQLEKEAQWGKTKNGFKVVLGLAGILNACVMTAYEIGKRTATRAASKGAESLFRSLSQKQKIVHIGGFAMGACMLPVNIYSLVTNAKKVSEAQKDKTGTTRAVPEVVMKLREMADELENTMPDENEFARQVDKLVSVAKSKDSNLLQIVCLILLAMLIVFFSFMFFT